MATELITFKMEGRLRQEVDEIVKSSGYHNRTEFIRDALRDKIQELRKQQALLMVTETKGITKKTSNKERNKIRDKILKELIKEKGWN